MKSILADISNKDYKQLYLLHGEEAYLKHQYRDKLKEALMDGADTMNYHYFEGKEVGAKGYESITPGSGTIAVLETVGEISKMVAAVHA